MMIGIQAGVVLTKFIQKLKKKKFATRLLISKDYNWVAAAADSVAKSNLPSWSGHDGWMDGWIACEECLSIR